MTSDGGTENGRRESRWASDAPIPTVFWNDLFSEKWDQYKSEIPPKDPPLDDAPLELAASKGNHWAQVMLISNASVAFETEVRTALRLTDM